MLAQWPQGLSCLCDLRCGGGRNRLLIDVDRLLIQAAGLPRHPERKQTRCAAPLTPLACRGQWLHMKHYVPVSLGATKDTQGKAVCSLGHTGQCWGHLWLLLDSPTWVHGP